MLRVKHASTLGKKQRCCLVSICFLLFLISPLTTVCLAAESGNEVAHSRKLDISVRERIKELSNDETITVLIKLQSADLRHVNKGMAVSTLRAHANSSQKRVLQFLNEEKGAVVLNTFWLTNILLVNTTAATLYRLIGLDVVQEIYENFEVIITEPSRGSGVASGDNTWGLDRINVAEVWALGFNGSGIRVCVLDTGVEISHPDLQDTMWTDNSSDPTFPGGWVEFDSNGNVVEGSTPHDTHGHGTHTSGTVVGGNASGVAIGVAPGAWLMHGLILPGGSGFFTQCIAGMQWAIDPVDQYGNPAGEAAAVVSMSWGASGYWDEMIEPIENMKAAGVIPVTSIGNGGAGSSGSPGNVYESFGIGAIDETDAVAYFSSGEEIDWPTSNPTRYIKPDFSAPGVSVYSSVPAEGWEYWSGTSMAAPHVAGTVALMLQANVGLTVDDVYDLLKITATDGGASGLDMRYGWGIINAYDAVKLTFADCGVDGYVLDENTSTPIDWEAHVTVTGIPWGNATTDGYYRIWLYPGNYSVTARSFGYHDQNATTIVLTQQWTRLNFSLTPMPQGFLAGQVTRRDTNNAIANATVTLRDTPLASATTNATGHYLTAAPVGSYDVDGWAWGYHSSTTHGAEIFENQTTPLDIQLEPTIRVAVLGDYRNQVTDLLMPAISAHERDWDVTQDIDNYDVVIVNLPSDPGEQPFRQLIEAADQSSVGLVFTNTWPGLWSPYGITLLQKYLSDPKGSYYAYWSGPVYYEVTATHPIFAGWNVGDKISLIEGGDYDCAWVYRYAGATIADIGSDSLGVLGCGVAYTVRPGGNVHVLLSGLAQNSYTNIDTAWTEDAKRIFRQTVTWASEPLPRAPPRVSTHPMSGPVSSKVWVNGSGFARDLPITIKFDDMPIATAYADVNGSFVAVFNAPSAEVGVHAVKALDASGSCAQTTYNITWGATLDVNVLEVTVDGGSLQFRGEAAGFSLLTTRTGVPVNVTTMTATLYKPDLTMEHLSAEPQATGLYRVAYPIQADAPTGTYILKVEAASDGVKGTSLHSFLVSSTLPNMNAALINFEDGMATIQTQVGVIELDMASVNARIDAVQGEIAVITTDIGEIKADLAYVKSIVATSNLTLIAIQGDTVIVRTVMGQIRGMITSVHDDVATVETALGQLTVTLPRSAGTTGVPTTSEADARLYMLLFFSGITVTAAIIAVVLVWGARRAPPFPGRVPT